MEADSALKLLVGISAPSFGVKAFLTEIRLWGTSDRML